MLVTAYLSFFIIIFLLQSKSADKIVDSSSKECYPSETLIKTPESSTYLDGPTRLVLFDATSNVKL